MKKSIFFDKETAQQLLELDKKMNSLASNYSAVVRLAIQRLYEEESRR